MNDAADKVTPGVYGKRPAPKLPTWAENAILYSINTRQFTPEGTFSAFAKHLPRLKRLGVTVLWFLPIHPIGSKNRKGTLGSYYSINDYYAINPEFGTLADFRALVQAIHALGMYVIIDLVINHTAWDHPLIAEHPEWYAHDENGRIIAPHAEWDDVADLDYGNEDLCNYMIEMMRFWVDDVGIDGFRCDVAERVPNDFWRIAIAEMQKIKAVLMLAEGQHPSLHAHGFHISYASDMYRLFNGIACGKRRAQEIDQLLEKDNERFPPGSRRLLFTSNHDQNSWHGSAIERLGHAAKAMAVLTFTLPGTPLIYCGQEVGNTKRLLFFDKDEIKWHEDGYTEFYQTLCRLYKSQPALYKGEMHTIESNRQQSVYAFKREYDDERILVIANLSTASVRATLHLKKHKALCGILGRNTAGKKITITLKPWECKIYQDSHHGENYAEIFTT
ncbi:alpha-glucosidase C-terminal domain-containing protein [candidate division KSB1 bacterium]|nr:alpha-glucosidase C-terminal domain-containing protein [candidate division KSB1 bacterium]